MKTETLPANIARRAGQQILVRLVDAVAEEDQLEPAAAVGDGDLQALAPALGSLKVSTRASATWATTVTCSSSGRSARRVSSPRSAYLRG